MAFVTLNIDKLEENYRHLDTLFKEKDIEWAVVAKMFCGNRTYLQALINLGVRQICDSRISNLRTVKLLEPEVETYFIKPAAKRNAEKVVRFADVSFNTSLETIKALSIQARLQNKLHKIVIMVELGERREGVMKEQLENFYRAVKKMPNIEVVGLGTNLTCMYGVLPDYDKLSELCACQKKIEKQFGDRLPLISGGASVTIPLIESGELPKGINHFRIGETLFLGTDVYHNEEIDNLHQDVFQLEAEIIELSRKPNKPSGKMGLNLSGEKISVPDSKETTQRAIIDIGLLDVEDSHLTPVEESMEIKGASSDMMVVDLGTNPENYQVGDMISFKMDYMGVLRLMHSKYVDKKIQRVEVPILEEELVLA